jgi:Circadian oscillating protein COP23
MKNLFSTPRQRGLMLAACAIASWIGCLGLLGEPVRAQTTTYFCAKGKEGIPTTYARGVTGKRIPIVRWQREWGGISREDRCQQVAANFQKASEEGALNYIKAGTLNGEKVVCSASEYGSCTNYLFTIKPGDNPNEVIKSLFGVNFQASGPLVQSGDGSTPISIDFNQLLRRQEAE